MHNRPAFAALLNRHWLLFETWLRRSGLGIGAWQAIDRDAQPERGSKELHGLTIPCLHRFVPDQAKAAPIPCSLGDAKCEPARTRYERKPFVNLKSCSPVVGCWGPDRLSLRFKRIRLRKRASERRRSIT